jgi:hypothetical protein
VLNEREVFKVLQDTPETLVELVHASGSLLFSSLPSRQVAAENSINGDHLIAKTECSFDDLINYSGLITDKFDCFDLLVLDGSVALFYLGEFSPASICIGMRVSAFNLHYLPSIRMKPQIEDFLKKYLKEAIIS